MNSCPECGAHILIGGRSRHSVWCSTLKRGIDQDNALKIEIDLTDFRATLERIRDQVIPPKPKPMTLERAVKILNEREHCEWDDWLLFPETEDEFEHAKPSDEESDWQASWILS